MKIINELTCKVGAFSVLGVGVGVDVGGTGVFVGLVVAVGGTGVLVGVAVGGTGVLVGRGVAVGGIGVLVGVAVGGIGVFVGVGGTGVTVGVAVGGTGVFVGSTGVAVGRIGVLVGEEPLPPPLLAVEEDPEVVAIGPYEIGGIILFEASWLLVTVENMSPITGVITASMAITTMATRTSKRLYSNKP